MKLIDINNLKPAGAQVATFHGFEHGAGVSFFVVEFSNGQGPGKHRHPYEETFIILDGEIELFLNDASLIVEVGKIAVIPAGTWHYFKVRSKAAVKMINIHPQPKMETEWA